MNIANLLKTSIQKKFYGDWGFIPYGTENVIVIPLMYKGKQSFVVMMLDKTQYAGHERYTENYEKAKQWAISNGLTQE